MIGTHIAPGSEYRKPRSHAQIPAPRETRLRKILCVALLLGFPLAARCGQKPTVYKGKEEKLPVEVAPQPILFSHKKHASIGLSCLDCHVDAPKKDQAGLPDIEKCMLCHAAIKTESPQVKKLAAAQARAEKVKWVRVYQVPDFVFFSHASHLKAGEQCFTCHGPVAERNVLAKEVSTSMITCMNCHAARNVSRDCSLCHLLGR